MLDNEKEPLHIKLLRYVMEYTHNRDSNYYVLFDLEDVKETTYLTTYIKNKERHFQKIFV